MALARPHPPPIARPGCGIFTQSREKRLMPVGLFRGEEGWVQVDYGTGTTIPVPRSKYELNKYEPDFDELPSEAEYWAAEKKKDDASPLGTSARTAPSLPRKSGANPNNH
jgi:hypothetical protein